MFEKAKIASIDVKLLMSKLRWAGHVSRLGNHRLPINKLSCNHSAGHRDKGASRKRFKDCLERSFGACDIDHRRWFILAENRDYWRLTIIHGVSSFENTGRVALKYKKHRRRNRNSMPSSYDQTFSCSRCDHASLSQIGLISHEYVYSQRGPPPFWCSFHEVNSWWWYIYIYT